MPTVVLASSSPYKAQLLEQLNIDFSVRSPDVDESRLRGEKPEDYVCRLAHQKAAAVAATEADSIVIGADQCSVCRDQILGKPHTQDNAIAQLSAASGQQVVLYTAVAVYDPATGNTRVAQVPTHVQFRRLQTEAIRRYVRADQPLDCAGAFRAEGLGISLFERIVCDDPSALIGLPLIALNRLLGQVGVARP